MAPNLLSVCVVMTFCPTTKVLNGNYNGMAWHHHDQEKYIILRGDAVLLKRGRNERGKWLFLDENINTATTKCR